MKKSVMVLWVVLWVVLLAALSLSPAYAKKGWEKRNAGLSVSNEFTFLLKHNLSVGFTMPDPKAPMPSAFYFRKGPFGGKYVSQGTEANTKGERKGYRACLTEVSADENQKLASFSIRTDLPDFVAKALQLRGKKKYTLKAVNQLIQSESDEFKNMTSRIQILTQDGTVVREIQQEDIVSPALQDLYPQMASSPTCR